MNIESDPKSSREIWIDFIKDIVGFDKGYYYTLRAIYQNPEEVFESYFNNKGKYLSPFTLLGVSFSIYYLISGFLVNWEIVSESLNHFYRSFIEWEVGLFSNITTEKKQTIIEYVYNSISVPMVDGMILLFSKYLIVVILPFQIIVFYVTSFFTKKLGYGFYHHFVSYNYFFSFSLLFMNAVILISLINVWLMIPCVLIFNYVFYGQFFKSYGEKRKQIKKAFLKGASISLLIIIVLLFALGITIGLFGGRNLIK